MEKLREPERLHDEGFSQEEFERAVELLENHSELIPKKVVFRIIRLFLTDETNSASLSSPTELELALQKHPEEKLLMRQVVEAYALVHGMRLIDDKLVSQSIREDREIQKENKKRSLFSRVFRAALNLDAREATALILEYEKLATEVAALEERKRTAQIGIAKAEEKAADIVQQSLVQSRERAQAVERESLASARHAVEQSQALTADAGARAERMLHEVLASIETERRESRIELEKIRNKIEEAEKEFEIKKALVEKVSQNPAVVEEWRKRNNEKGDDLAPFKKEITKMKRAMWFIIRQIRNTPTFDNKPACAVEIRKIFSHFKMEIFERIQGIDYRFGPDIRSQICIEIAESCEKMRGGVYKFKANDPSLVADATHDFFYSNKLCEYIDNLSDPTINCSEAINQILNEFDILVK